MATFAYQALSANGGQTRGKIDADDEVAAQRALEAQGLIPLEVSAAEAGWRGDRVPRAQVLAFSRSLAGLLSAGVPLSRALTVIEREATHTAARNAWARIHSEVKDGNSLAEALSRASAAQPGLFAPVFIAMVKAGETGGFLAVVLDQVADYLERQRELTNRVVTALVYPALLLTIAGGVVTFLLIWFIPRFAELFASFHRELPPLTLLIQAVSHLLVHYGWIVLLVVLGGVFAGRKLLATEAGGRWWEDLMMRLPGIGEVRTGLARVRFCRMLGTLLGAGVPLLNALSVARETVGSRSLASALNEAGERIRQGSSLTAGLAGLDALLPPTAREALAVAESSGRLPQELLRLADTGERDLDRRLRTLVALAEPLLLLLMASIVGTIVIGMLLPIFDLWSAIK